VQARQGPVIPHVSPDPPGRTLPLGQDTDGGVVAHETLSGEHMALDQVEQRHDGEGPVADLVGQRRQRKVYPLALEACTLAVERDTQGGDGLKLRILAKLNLERQIGSESAPGSIVS